MYLCTCISAYFLIYTNNYNYNYYYYSHNNVFPTAFLSSCQCIPPVALITNFLMYLYVCVCIHLCYNEREIGWGNGESKQLLSSLLLFLLSWLSPSSWFFPSNLMNKRKTSNWKSMFFPLKKRVDNLIKACLCKKWIGKFFKYECIHDIKDFWKRIVILWWWWWRRRKKKGLFFYIYLLIWTVFFLSFKNTFLENKPFTNHKFVYLTLSSIRIVCAECEGYCTMLLSCKTWSIFQSATEWLEVECFNQ